MTILLNKTLRFFGILMLLLVVACSPAPGMVETPKATREITPQPSAKPTKNQPTPKPATEIPTATESPALENGLWLVLRTESGVKAFNRENGRRVNLMGGLEADQPVSLSQPVNNSGWFALIDGQHVALQFFQLPDGKMKKEIPLLAHAGISTEKLSAYRQTITAKDPPAVVWSPDGQRAAFLAAIDHAYLELYLFDTTDLSISALSEGGQDVYQPVWSPDGEWLVYNETDGLNTVGLWAVTAVKCVRSNAAEIRTIYEPQSYAEPLLGWNSPTTFIVHSVRDRGPINLRQASLDGGASKPIFTGVFSNPVFDADDGLAAFLISDSFIDPKVQPVGLYTGSVTRPARLLGVGLFTALSWDETTGAFFSIKEESSAVSFTLAGKSTIFHSETTLPRISPQGDLAAFAGGRDAARPGVRLYSIQGSQLAFITQNPVEEIEWLPDNNLVYRDGADLYQVGAIPGEPTRLAENAALLGWLDYRASP